MLYTKSILKPKSLEDGLRISVMSRHTLNDGITPDERITSDSYELWVKKLAPPDNLVGDFYKRNLPRKKYNRKYLGYLRKEEMADYVKWIGGLALEKDVTILCIEDDALDCHRSVLANECKRHYPDLKVEHR